MIAFRYTKQDGAEFISHLDTLRHLNKTFIRAGFSVKLSQGFHPHMLVYMSSPIGVGLKSKAEYCTVETDVSPSEFVERFNQNSPKGIKCVEAYTVNKNPNFASCIARAQFYIEGICSFDVDELMNSSSFTVQNKKGEDVEVRDKIFSVKKRDNGIVCVLSAGNNALRSDIFAKKLVELYGGEVNFIIKERAFLANGKPVERLFAGK